MAKLVSLAPILEQIVLGIGHWALGIGVDLMADCEYDNQYQNLKYSQDTTKLLSEV